MPKSGMTYRNRSSIPKDAGADASVVPTTAALPPSRSRAKT
jgi:hypothetical protein